MARTFARTPNSQEEFVKNLDPLLKRKRSSGVVFGENVNPGVFRLPGMGVNPEQLLSSRSVTGFPQTPYAGFQPQPIESIEQIDPVLQGDLPNDVITANDLLEIVNSVRGDSGQEAVSGGDPQAVQQMSDGGVLYEDGVIRYNDGTEREFTGADAQPSQTLPDGSVGYSDGSVKKPAATPQQQLDNGLTLYSDGTIRTGNKVFTGYGFVPFDTFQSYLQSISGGNLGESNITGEFGANYGFGTEARNIGLDISRPGVATKVYSPVNGVVVSINRFPYQIDPTTGAVVGGAQAGYTRDDLYGNSVLIKMANGEYLRFSHLSNEQLANLQEGQNVSAGQFLGVIGNTGNTTGEHLDNEYITADGQVHSVRDFVNKVATDQTYRQTLQYTPDAFNNSEAIADISGGEVVGRIDPSTGAPMSTTQDLIEQGGNDSQQPQPLQQSQPEPIQQLRTVAPELPVVPLNPLHDTVIGDTIKDYGESISEPGMTSGTRDFNITEGIASLTGIQPEGQGDINLETPLGIVNVPDYGVSEDASSFIKNAIDKVGQTLQAATSVGTVYAETKGKNDGDFRNKTALPTQGEMSKLPTPDANTAAFTPARGTPATGQSGGEQGQVLGSQADRALSLDNQDNLGVGDMSPANQITQAQPERPLSAGEQRLNTLANQGKTPATSKKAAKISKRLSEIKQKYGVEGLTSSTATGYVNPLAEAKANIENKVKDVYYKSGLNNGSFDKFLQKTGNAGRDIVENAKGIVGDISRKAGQGVKDTRFTLDKAADAGLFSPKSAAYKMLQFGEKLQKGAENVKKQATAAGQIVSGKAQPELSSYIAPLLSRSAVKNMTVFERKLKKVFGR